MDQSELFSTILLWGAVVLALLIRLRRMTRDQRLYPGRLWIVPAIILLIVGFTLWQNPPGGLGWLWIALGCAVGAPIGWWRARLVSIRRDAESGLFYQRSSPAVLVFLLLLIGLRSLLHWLVQLSDAHWHLGALLVSNIFLAFAVGVVVAYRVEIWWRVRSMTLGPEAA